MGRPDPIETVKNEIGSDFPEIMKEIEDIENTLTVGHTKAVGFIFGSPCYNPGSFLGSLHAVKTSEHLARLSGRQFLPVAAIAPGHSSSGP